MTYALILIPFMCFVAGGALGYFLGRYQSVLIDKIRTLEAGNNQPVPEKPTVIMGGYAPIQAVSTATDDRSAGLVESKTPERVDWETKQAIEKEGRGL
jgi:hypothetical protein